MEGWFWFVCFFCLFVFFFFFESLKSYLSVIPHFIQYNTIQYNTIQPTIHNIIQYRRELVREGLLEVTLKCKTAKRLILLFTDIVLIVNRKKGGGELSVVELFDLDGGKSLIIFKYVF